MRMLTIKEILMMTDDELEKIMTEEEKERAEKLGLKYTWQLLNLLQDGARLSGLQKDEEYVTITEYLDYLEEKE